MGIPVPPYRERPRSLPGIDGVKLLCTGRALRFLPVRLWRSRWNALAHCFAAFAPNGASPSERSKTGLSCWRSNGATVIANQSDSISESSPGWARVSTHSEHQRTRNWTADIAKNGSDFLADKTIISDFVTQKNFVIRFASASGDTITDEYLTGGLSIESLRADCPALFKRR